MKRCISDDHLHPAKTLKPSSTSFGPKFGRHLFEKEETRSSYAIFVKGDASASMISNRSSLFPGIREKRLLD